MVLLRKQKDFSFLGSVPTWVSVKKHKRVLKCSVGDHQRRKGSKNKHIHRKVKCAHLVLEPGRR
jgi:ribosomal protein L39E